MMAAGMRTDALFPHACIAGKRKRRRNGFDDAVFLGFARP
jgi:hypothetical protein